MSADLPLMKNVLKWLPKNALVQLRFMAAASVTNAAIENVWIRNDCTDNLGQKMKDIKKIVKSIK